MFIMDDDLVLVYRGPEVSSRVGGACRTGRYERRRRVR